MFRIALFVMVISCTAAHSQIDFESRICMEMSVMFGGQDNLIGLSLNVGNVIQNSIVAAELNGAIGLDFFLTKYGAISKGMGINMETYCIVGKSNNNKNVPFYSGDLSIVSIEERKREFQTFSGVGFGVKKTIIKGELKHLANRQGMILVRAKTSSDNLLLIRVKNDFRGGLMLGSGTDQGETGSIYVGYSFIDKNAYSHTFGANLALFTPKPDYSKNPTNEMNSSEGSRPVLYGVQPYGDLFHGNFFASYQFRSPNFAQYLGLGIDSQKLGGKLQNMLHDSFGLYPRFGWDREANNKIYFQSKSSLIEGI